jgi:geranyl-CoA carboxylase alpha subunit
MMGHAIEARLYAEDPSSEFMPQSGRILSWIPAEGPGIRVDHGLNTTDAISPFYDPMVAKVIAHGTTREQARVRLLAALNQTELLGLTTNKRFLHQLLDAEAFIAGEATTALAGEVLAHSAESTEPDPETLAVAAVILMESASRDFPELVRGWRSTGRSETMILLQQGEQRTPVAVSQSGSHYEIETCGSTHAIVVDDFGAGSIRLRDGRHTEAARFALEGQQLFLELDGRSTALTDVTYAPAEASEAGADGLVRAPMNGRILGVRAAPGDAVKKGQVLLIHEAMKMENQILAPFDGMVESISVAEGDQVETRQILATLKHEEAEDQGRGAGGIPKGHRA